MEDIARLAEQQKVVLQKQVGVLTEKVRKKKRELVIETNLFFVFLVLVAVFFTRELSGNFP